MEGAELREMASDHGRRGLAPWQECAVEATGRPPPETESKPRRAAAALFPRQRAGIARADPLDRLRHWAGSPASSAPERRSGGRSTRFTRLAAGSFMIPSGTST